MDDSVTVCNLESELSSENEDIEKSHTVSTNQQITVVVNSAKDLQKHSNRSRMLSDSWGNLRVAMIKQAKMLNHRFKIKPSQRLTSEFPYKKKMKNYSILVNKKISITKEAEVALEQPEASTSNNIHNESLLDHHSLSSQKENDIEMDEFEDLSKQNSNALNTTKSCKSENNTYSSDETVQIDLSKVHSQVEEQVSPTILKHEKISYDILGTTINKNMKADEMKLESLAAGLSVLKKPLIVRKPTLTMNGLENDLNNLPKIVAVRSLQKPAGIIAKGKLKLKLKTFRPN